MANKDITFNDISLGLQIAVIIAYITGFLLAYSFLIGFFYGVAGA